MNTGLIINELVRYKKMRANKELAEFLGVSEQVLSSWKKRDYLDYKLILSKMPELDANWLITGKGNMLRSGSEAKSVGGVAFGDGSMNHSNSNDIIERFINEIAEQRKLTQETVSQNSRLISLLERH